MSEGNGREHIGTEIDTENQYGRERERNGTDDENKVRDDFRHVRRQSIGDRFAQIIENHTSCTKREKDTHIAIRKEE